MSSLFLQMPEHPEHEYSKALWGQVLASVRAPPREKTQWVGTAFCKLSVVIVEPRCHEWLRAVIYNMAHVYGGGDTALHIFHGTENDTFVRDICRDFSGVVFHDLGVPNLTIDEYNRLLTSADFWSMNSEYALIFQTDTIIRRRIDPVFFNVDYVGAPWPFKASHVLRPEKNVGNGGFSLRRVDTMRSIAALDVIPDEGQHEDVFFAERVSHDRLPTTEQAMSFSVEHMWHDNPCGAHQAWRFHSRAQIHALLSDLPGT